LIPSVEQLRAFGSYITDRPDLGEIDLVFTLRHRYPPEQWMHRSRQRAPRG
jgi:hypothetical protein